jgi:hypothetical protein
VFFIFLDNLGVFWVGNWYIDTLRVFKVFLNKNKLKNRFLRSQNSVSIFLVTWGDWKTL